MGKYTCPVCTVCGPIGKFDEDMKICDLCLSLELDATEQNLINYVTLNIVPYWFEEVCNYFNPKGKVVERLKQIASCYGQYHTERFQDGGNSTERC